uniref:Uncharacterized protein n=1 Tax=Meloidogyne enterolobii TaxID=390850 RepID=A0A6V7X3R1_MELEN|nr:unnamed protein product [Meloidogyne enterolobii]
MPIRFVHFLVYLNHRTTYLGPSNFHSVQFSSQTTSLYFIILKKHTSSIFSLFFVSAIFLCLLNSSQLIHSFLSKVKQYEVSREGKNK